MSSKIKKTDQVEEKGSVVVCQKCGGTKGWDGPRYVPERVMINEDRTKPDFIKRTEHIIGEHLIYACRVCGYTVALAPGIDHATNLTSLLSQGGSFT